MKAAALLLCLVLVGCDNSFYPLVSETMVDPSIQSPSATRFTSLSGIGVSWNTDAHATGYVLSRRLLTSTSWLTVYTGSGTGYVDASAQPDTMYAYNLAKYRGSKLFPVGPQALGAWNTSYVAFPLGDNSSKSGAVPVSTDTVSGTIFYYSTAVDAVTGQQDLITAANWYYIDLGPRLQEYLVFTYGNSAQSGDLVVSTTSDTIVNSGNEFAVFNSATTPQRVWFNVHFNPAVASTGTQIYVNYQMAFNRIANYP